MEQRYQEVVDSLRADVRSGATDIVSRAAALLIEVAEQPAVLIELAVACAGAQPAMAGLLTLESLVRTAPDPRSALERFTAQVRRAPDAIARHAAALLSLRPERRSADPQPLRVVTCSSSRAVEATLVAAARAVDLRISCAESRPKREGEELANRLAKSGLAVELFSDAGISSAVLTGDALLVGADAVGPDFFVNKVGTAALCALAQAHGIPVYVLAGREKVLSGTLAARLQVVEAPPEQISTSAHPSVTLRNPLFERVPIGLVTYLVTDAGAKNLM